MDIDYSKPGYTTQKLEKLDHPVAVGALRLVYRSALLREFTQEQHNIAHMALARAGVSEGLAESEINRMRCRGVEDRVKRRGLEQKISSSYGCELLADSNLGSNEEYDWLGPECFGKIDFKQTKRL